jgi:hypothetical protein
MHCFRENGWKDSLGQSLMAIEKLLKNGQIKLILSGKMLLLAGSDEKSRK